jgi:hypothetical protein
LAVQGELGFELDQVAGQAGGQLAGQDRGAVGLGGVGVNNSKFLFYLQ